jgi:hypothetical protein
MAIIMNNELHYLCEHDDFKHIAVCGLAVSFILFSVYLIWVWGLGFHQRRAMEKHNYSSHYLHGHVEPR